MNVISLQASLKDIARTSSGASTDSLSINLATKRVKNDAAIRIQKFVRRKTALPPLKTQTQKMNEKMDASEKEFQDIFQNFFGKSPEEYSAQKDHEIQEKKRLAFLANPEEVARAKQIAAEARDRADAQFLKTLNNIRFDETNVRELLKTYSYLTAEEILMESKKDIDEPCLAQMSIQREKDIEEAFRRKCIQQATAENITLPPLIDRKIDHANLNETQKMKLRTYKSLSLQEIENKIKKANLNGQEVEKMLLAQVGHDATPQSRDTYVNICKEIYISKKRDEIIEAYKDCNSKEMANKLETIDKKMPPSSFLRKIYRDILFLKINADLVAYAAEHNGAVDDAFFESYDTSTTSSTATASSESSAT